MSTILTLLSMLVLIYGMTFRLMIPLDNLIIVIFYEARLASIFLLVFICIIINRISLTNARTITKLLYILITYFINDWKNKPSILTFRYSVRLNSLYNIYNCSILSEYELVRVFTNYCNDSGGRFYDKKNEDDLAVINVMG
jgi:hypothetical protein